MPTTFDESVTVEAVIEQSDDHVFKANKAIRRNTNDGADSGTIELNGGGGTGSTRGGAIRVGGNEAGSPGWVSVVPGNVAGSKFEILKHNGTAAVDVLGSTGVATFNAAIELADDQVFTANKVIRRSTSDGADNGSLEMNGGGGAGSGRGGAIKVWGNEGGNPGAVFVALGNLSSPGNARFQVQRHDGNAAIDVGGALGDVTFTPTAGSAIAIDSSGLYPATSNAVPCGRSGKLWTAVWATNGTIQTSDAALKEDISDADLGLEFVNSLRPVSYRWKDGDRGVHYGLVAQDVRRVAPAASSFVVDGDALGMNYAEYTAPLIKSIQELSRAVDALSRRVRELEAAAVVSNPIITGADSKGERHGQ